VQTQLDSIHMSPIEETLLSELAAIAPSSIIPKLNLTRGSMGDLKKIMSPTAVKMLAIFLNTVTIGTELCCKL